MSFNQAVNLARSVTFDTDLSQADIIQDNISKLSIQAEKYILKVYLNDNSNKKAVQALFYISRLQYDNKKSDEFRQKCVELGINLDLD
jgi:hypothetical protein